MCSTVTNYCKGFVGTLHKKETGRPPRLAATEPVMKPPRPVTALDLVVAIGLVLAILVMLAAISGYFQPAR